MSCAEPTAVPSFPSTDVLTGMELAARWSRAGAKVHWKEPGQVLPLCGAWPVIATCDTEEALTCWECAERLMQRQLLHREGLA